MLVDLAGSERLKDAFQNRQETATINKSLFCLGKVVNALAERNTNPSIHVPYRDSVLTKLLMEGLGGKALTLLITCISPCDLHVEETLNTLMYAQKAKGILISLPVMHHPEDKTELTELRKEVKMLRAQNSKLRDRLEATNEKQRTIMNHAPLQLTSQHFTDPQIYPGASSKWDPSSWNVANDRWISGYSLQNDREWNRASEGTCRIVDCGDTILNEITSLKNKLKSLEHKLNDST